MQYLSPPLYRVLYEMQFGARFLPNTAPVLTISVQLTVILLYDRPARPLTPDGHLRGSCGASKSVRIHNLAEQGPACAANAQVAVHWHIFRTVDAAGGFDGSQVSSCVPTHPPVQATVTVAEYIRDKLLDSARSRKIPEDHAILNPSKRGAVAQK